MQSKLHVSHSMFRKINKLYLIPLILIIVSFTVLAIVFQGNFGDSKFLNWSLLIINSVNFILLIIELKKNWATSGKSSKPFSFIFILFWISIIFDSTKFLYN